jgi:hypothetical protein
VVVLKPRQDPSGPRRLARQHACNHPWGPQNLEWPPMGAGNFVLERGNVYAGHGVVTHFLKCVTVRTGGPGDGFCSSQTRSGTIGTPEARTSACLRPPLWPTEPEVTPYGAGNFVLEQRNVSAGHGVVTHFPKCVTVRTGGPGDGCDSSQTWSGSIGTPAARTSACLRPPLWAA